MKILTLTILLFLFLRIGLATPQYPDILIYNGDTLSVYSNPLEYFYDEQNPRPLSFFYDFENTQDRLVDISMSTACWRGYIATWEIFDNQLYLIEISECEGNKNADLERIFPKRYSEGKVIADWFNGLLVLPFGEITEYVHMGYSSLFEEYKILEIKAGVFTKEKLCIGKEYSNFKKRQFEQYKKTAEFKKQFERLKTEMDVSEIEAFLFEFVTEYTKEFLVD